MKILHVIPSMAAADGGPSRAMAEVEKALAERGISCTTVTTDAGLPAGSLPLETPIATAFSTRLYFHALTRFYKISPALARWLANNVQAFDIVHIHALFNFPPIAAAYAARRARIPYIVRPLGVLRSYGMRQRRPALKKLSFALLERRVLEAADAIHFTSAVERSEAEALHLRCKSAVIPIGINVPSARARGNNSGDFRLLLVSRIDPVKNIEGLLHATALLRGDFPRLTLDIVGAGSPAYVEGLKALAAQLGVADQVNWLGYLDGARKDEIMQAATAFVLPSHSESFGISAVEALAVGLPSVVSKGVAVAPDIATAKAGVVVDTDPESIAAGIRSVLSDCAGYAAMRAAAHALAATSFSNAAMGQRLESLYREISDQRRH